MASLGPKPSASPVDQLYSQSRERFKIVQGEVAQIERLRAGLDRLLEKGDMVTQEDVLDEMSELVARGADPKMFAAIMAGNPQGGLPPMPSGGQALAGWLSTTEQQVIAPYEQQLAGALALTQHQLGVSAMHKIIQHRAGQMVQGRPVPLTGLTGAASSAQGPQNGPSNSLM